MGARSRTRKRGDHTDREEHVLVLKVHSPQKSATVGAAREAGGAQGRDSRSMQPALVHKVVLEPPLLRRRPRERVGLRQRVH